MYIVGLHASVIHQYTQSLCLGIKYDYSHT